MALSLANLLQEVGTALWEAVGMDHFCRFPVRTVWKRFPLRTRTEAGNRGWGRTEVAAGAPVVTGTLGFFPRALPHRLCGGHEAIGEAYD